MPRLELIEFARWQIELSKQFDISQRIANKRHLFLSHLITIKNNHETWILSQHQSKPFYTHRSKNLLILCMHDCCFNPIWVSYSKKNLKLFKWLLRFWNCFFAKAKQRNKEDQNINVLSPPSYLSISACEVISSYFN